MPHQGASNWQAVLQDIIQSPKERQRLATALGINVITLTRWARADSQPQRPYLVRLVKVVQPHQRGELLNALLEAYPDMQDKFMEEISETIPSSFCRQILRDRASIIETLRPWQLSSAILNEAITLLDPHQLGMAVTPALCMPPINGKIRSLREHGGRGTVLWASDLEHKSIFLGLNSLAGYVVQSGREQSVREVKKEKYIPVFAYPEDVEVSAAAAPIWLEGRIAGCLLAASTQVEHFTQTRMDLLVNFAHIFSLALNPGDFYDHSLVSLRYIPRPSVQEVYLKSFRQRVARLLAESSRHGQEMSNAEAERRAWLDIEETLLEVGAQMEDTPEEAEEMV